MVRRCTALLGESEGGPALRASMFILTAFLVRHCAINTDTYRGLIKDK
jgi:hypothetical protein